MATGGIFTIITNDGKQDRMLMATALLHDRLDKIWKAKKANNPGAADDDVSVLPSLIDIEKTHILFTNAHFKPFAAIGFEYHKTNPTSGNTTLGSTIQFSIPQFGDFFHDITFHAILTQPTLASTATLAQDGPAMRWCTWPGERLLKKVQQEVNGNPLDEYTLHATVAHREYRVAPNKLTAWKRCVGQEEPIDGYVRQANWANNGLSPEAFRVGSKIYAGNQTPSGQKTGSLELFVPLLFWYNKDVRLAVPSVAIPYGQRFINIELASAAEMVGMYPRGAGTWASPGGTLTDPTLTTVELYINNIFVNPEIHKIYIKRVGFSLIRVHRQQILPLNGLTASAEFQLVQLKWPVEYLYVGAKIKDYFSPTTDALKRQHLQHWDKYGVCTETSYNVPGQKVHKEMAFVPDATGLLTLGVAASGANTASAALTGTALTGQIVTAGDLLYINSKWYTVVVGVAAGAAVTGISVQTLTNDGATVASTAIAAASKQLTLQGTELAADVWTNTLDSVGIRAHGVDLYKEYNQLFFNAYTTYHYGGPNINAPSDANSLFITFSFYPGTYQPSGHINVSRAREFFLSYSSAYFGANNVAGLLIVIASAINFLLISDGSAVLRYST